MRLVQVIIPAGMREAVLDVLDDEEIDYVITDETSGRDYTAVIYFPLPMKAVEPVLTRLHDVGLEERAYTVVIDAETVVSRRFEQLKERYEEESENGDRIARQELQARAEDLMPPFAIYTVMTVVSAVVATAGLLLDSPAVVVGSMVIAPLIGPAMSTAVGTVIGDRKLFSAGTKQQLFGYTISIAAAALFASLVRYANLVPPNTDVVSIEQVRQRLTPDFLSLVVALGAGTAGAFSLSAGVSATLVGVMIAVALVPPVATIGIGIAWGLPSVVVGSTVLAMVNVLSINLSALATLWHAGYRPQSLFQLTEARAALFKRIAALAFAIAVLSVFLGGVTYDSYRNAQSRDQIQTEVSEVVSNAEGVALLETQIIMSESEGLNMSDPTRLVFHHPKRVVVTVGVELGVDPPPLADSIQAAIEDNLSRPVEVQVRYVSVDERSRRLETVNELRRPDATAGRRGGRYIKRPLYSTTS